MIVVQVFPEPISFNLPFITCSSISSILQTSLTTSGKAKQETAVRPTMASKSLFFFLLSLFFSLSIASPLIKRIGSRSGDVAGDDYNCVYTLFIRTGSIWKGGTDSIITVTLIGSDGYGVEITDIESWGGLMGDGYNYFERSNLDIFSGRGPCMSSTPCWMNLTSDGSGAHHGWYCNYVEVTVTGPHMGCNQQLFTVEQWLATDASPYQLYAVRDYCSSSSSSAASHLGRRIGGEGRHVGHVVRMAE